MGRPRKGKADTQSVSSEEGSHSDKLDEILERLSTLDNINNKLMKLEKMLAATQAENKKLRETVAA
jgi:hypothetical protein